VLSARFGELDEAPLMRSPIVSVVWQLRFEDHPVLTSPETILRFHELLGGPAQFFLAPIPRLQLSVQPITPTPENAPKPQVGASGGGWRLTSADGSWSISVEPVSLAVETTRYGTWQKDFLPMLQQVLDALQKAGAPVIETRLGLRYINVLTGSAIGKPPIASPNELSGLIAPWLLGPLQDPDLQDAVQASQGRVVLTIDQATVIVNYGVITTETHELGYAVDIDAYRESGRALRIEDIISGTSTLHSAALGLFQASFTKETMQAMRSSDASAEDPS
jgi:uncharacterized protein (TIGR04255 family)